MATGEDKKLIKIFVKTPQHKETIEIDEKAAVTELKTLVSSKFKAEPDLLCLIFAGKILKDNETLEQHKITDGLTIHLVIRPKKKPESQTNTSTSNNESSNPSTTTSTTSSTTTTPSTASTNASSNPFGMMNLGGLGDFERDMMNNPEFTSQLMNNPLVQELMSNPDNIRAMLSMNPQFQQLIERNPEINHLLNNNEILRSSMEMMRNPSAFQELMRTQDRALSNLESLPGGHAALRRMYTELQEPMLNAASEQLGDNPFASFARQNNSSNASSTNTQAGTENRDPLPNPWNRDSSTTNTAGSNTQASNPLGNRNSANMFSQMLENRELMNSVLNSPQTQSLMQQMASNPELMQRMMANSPLMSSDPTIQQQMSNLLPNAFQQLQSPELRQALTNPEALEAMMQITRGIETLQRVSPVLFNTMMGGNAGASGFPFSSIGTANPASATTTTNTSTTNTSTTGNNSTTATTPNLPNSNQMSQLNQMLSQMFAGSLGSAATPGGNQPQSQQPPEERYRNQLEQLTAMGFNDRQQNLNALIESFGDVNGAIERLLSRGSYFS